MQFGTGLVDKDGNKRKKFALVGFAESSRHLAPYDDDSWHVAAMNQLYRHIPRADSWWEMHLRKDFLADQVPGTDYLAWLKDCPIPIHMIEHFEDIPNSVQYPIDSMVEKFGDYFYSTISYMIAYAIAEGFEEIGIWGVDLSHDSEYEYQKPSAEYLLGVAKGMGIKVTIAPQSALLKGVYRYGYDPLPNKDDLQWLEVYKGRVNQKAQETVGLLNQIQGQVSLMEEIIGNPDPAAHIREILPKGKSKLQEQVGLMNMLQGQIACAEEFMGWHRSKLRGSAPPDPNLPNPDTTAVNT